MSKVSISKNYLAEKELDKAIANYNNAKTTISNGNNNSKTNEIINMINQNLNDISESKKEINKINIQINNKLKELENLTGDWYGYR